MKQTLACATSNHDKCGGTTATGDAPVDAAFPPEPCACICHVFKKGAAYA